MSTNAAPAATSAPAPAAASTQQPGPAGDTPPPQQESKKGGSVQPERTIEDPKSVEATRGSDKYEIKVNGKSKMVSRDELIRLAQLSEAATERFESAAQKEKRAQQVIARAKSNPIEHLMDPELGLNKEQVRAAMEEWYSREFIEPETLTQEQRQLKELQRENAMFKKLQEEKKQNDIKEAQEKAESEYAQHFQQQIIDAMEASKLPKTKTMVKRIAFYMRQSLANGWEAPMDLIIQKVKDDRRNEDSEINEYSYDDIVDRFGEDFVKKLITENLNRLRDRRASQGGSSFSGKSAEPADQKSDKISMREAALRLKAMRQGR